MSSQKGNICRNRPQKHQNSVAFKNNLHDTSNRTKIINNTKIEHVCIHCKQVIEWKIKYKKYKPLTQARTCVRCNQKNVKTAYHVMCAECARKLNSCAKCCKENVEICVSDTQAEEINLTTEMKDILQSLPERKRRTFMRFMKKNKIEPAYESGLDVSEKIMSKLKALVLENDNLKSDEEDDEYSD